MNEDRLIKALRERRLPNEELVSARAWEQIRAEHARRQPNPERNGRWRWVAAVVSVSVAVGMILSPAGAAVREWIADAVKPGIPSSDPVLDDVPGGGRLIVGSRPGPWVVQPDGSKRLLGEYAEATWSPRGLFLAVSSGSELIAVEPDGDPRWTVSADGPVRSMRWAPSGVRIAYRSGDAMRVVAGDGSEDRLIDANVAAVSAAWMPEPEYTGSAGELPPKHVLAYVDRKQTVRVVATDTGEGGWQARQKRRVLALEWTDAGDRLQVLTSRGLATYEPDGDEAESYGFADRARGVAIAPAPSGKAFAVITHRAHRARSSLSVRDAGSERELFSGPGRFSGVSWSPDGSWLLLEWPAADQWIFIDMRGGRVHPVSNVSRQFDPGGERPRFPSVEGWCCR